MKTILLVLGLYYNTVTYIVTPSNLILHTSLRGKKLQSPSSNSYSLWHRRLGHISYKRIDWLVIERVLQTFDVRYIEKCVSCIKGKNTRTTRKGSSRATELLHLIHTDTCEPFLIAIRNGHRYFITFTDDYSRYGYNYLIRDKSESLDTFKIFKIEVENQLNKRIKGVRSDRGGEFYGRSDASSEQCPRSFARYLEQLGIFPQYTMPGTPSMNGIAERRNRILQDMVRSMMAESLLHIRLWGEALKIAIYLLKRVPTKETIKIPNELWTRRKPSLKHLHIWGSPAQARPYVPKDKKLDSRTISCYFVRYLEKSWGFKFYDPSTRGIFEIGNAHLFEDIEFVGEIKLETLTFRKNTMIVLIHKVI